MKILIKKIRYGQFLREAAHFILQVLGGALLREVQTDMSCSSQSTILDIST